MIIIAIATSVTILAGTSGEPPEIRLAPIQVSSVAECRKTADLLNSQPPELVDQASGKMIISSQVTCEMMDLDSFDKLHAQAQKVPASE